MNALEQIGFFPFLEDELRALFAAEAAHFFAGVFGSDGGELQFTLDGEIEPFLGARFELKPMRAARRSARRRRTG